MTRQSQRAAPETVGQGSRSLLDRARRSVAGGASSTMRVLPYHLPLVVDRAEGPHIWDADGNRLVDLNMAYGPLIFGHRPPLIVEALQRELSRRGTVLGFPHRLSHEVAELVKKSMPSIHKLRFASSGTEVLQTAVRLARAHTGREMIVLFEGHYHGSSDAVFHRYHASAEELDSTAPNEPLSGTAGMTGAPAGAYLLPWNDAGALEALLARHGERIAAVLMEPVMGNAAVVPPADGYLQAARALTRKHGALLIFDEVITGFRVARGGAQQRYGVAADITTLSKALNGGVPVSAVGGRAEVMELLADGTVFHGGVYSGNPLGLAAALAVQQEYDRRQAQIYRALELAGRSLAAGLSRIFAAHGVPALIQRVGPMLGLTFLRDDPGTEGIQSYRRVLEVSRPRRRILFQQAAQAAGVYLHPNQFEPIYLSTAHTPEVIEEVLQRLDHVAGALDWDAPPALAARAGSADG